MQKIDKSTILSKNYEKWLSTLGDEHPKYNSSNNKYYDDIKMSLLYCQDGLCAYTEDMLCDEKYFDITNWDDGKYKTKLTQDEKHKIRGDLEHFDESLKEKQAWLWDNLFMVDTHVNCRIKHSKPIKNILKPDSPSYDPYKYLYLNAQTAEFLPNINLTEQEKEDVKYMIDTLGLNCIPQRKRQLEEWKDLVEIGLSVQPYRFITAWNMTLKQIQPIN